MKISCPSFGDTSKPFLLGKKAIRLPKSWEEIMEGLKIVESEMGAYFGDPSNPLVLCVHSGAAIPMPGMMDNALNLGLNDKVVVVLAVNSGECFASDSYRRFLDIFRDVVRTETSPEDIGGMHAANGILTTRGGMTSHAAVVARGWGKGCVCVRPDLRVNDADKVVVIGDKVIGEGEWLSLNGSTGDVILGKQSLAPPALSPDLMVFMSWVDVVRSLKAMANADTPKDALTARNNDAQGIELCRTEHMLFASDERIKTVRKKIMTATMEQRQVALDLLLPDQRSDFEGIFCAMDGCPVTIRLLDPPLHELLPEGDVEQIVCELTAETGMTEDEVFSRVEKLSEVNPMLGFQGCRLGLSYPELTEMQARTIFQTAINMTNHVVEVFPEIMVPLVVTPQELGHQVQLIRSIADKVFSEMGCKVL